MIDKLISVASSSVYQEVNFGGQISKGYFGKNIGGGNSYPYSFYKNFNDLRPSFETDGGVTKIRKNEYNILTSIDNNSIIPWSVSPAVKSGSIPGPITMQFPNVNGQPGGLAFPFNNQSATITFNFYTQSQNPLEDFSNGFDVEVLGTYVKKLRLNFNYDQRAFVLLDLDTLIATPSDEMQLGNVGTTIHEITIESIGLNKYRVKCSYNHNNYFAGNERKLSVGILPATYGNDIPIDANTPTNQFVQLNSGDGIIIDRYFSNKGISKYNYVVGWTSDEEQTLSFDESGECPLAVGPLTVTNHRLHNTFSKEGIPNPGYEGVYTPNGGTILNDVLYENTNTPSVFYGEDAYKLVFTSGILNNQVIFSPPGVPYPTTPNTKLRAFTIPVNYSEGVNNKVFCFSFYTKYVEPQSGDRIGRYVGISPFSDSGQNSYFTTNYQKTPGQGIDDLYFTTIDLKNKTVVSYQGGLDYIEDVAIVEIPNSGGWIKIVYRAEAVNKDQFSSTWPFVNPVLALVNSVGIPQLEPSPLATDDYFIMEYLNTSPFKSFFEVHKNPLSTLDRTVQTNSMNLLSFESQRMKDLNIAFKYKGNSYSVFSFKLELNGGSQNGNFYFQESLSFIRDAEKQYKLYHSANFNGVHSSVLNGQQVNFTFANSVNVGNINLSDSKIISYRKDNQYHVIVNNQEFILPVVEDIQKYLDISNGIRQDSLNGSGGLGAYLYLFTNPAAYHIIPEFEGLDQIEYNPSFCSNDKIGNCVVLEDYPNDVEIEILKSSL